MTNPYLKRRVLSRKEKFCANSSHQEQDSSLQGLLLLFLEVHYGAREEKDLREPNL